MPQPTRPTIALFLALATAPMARADDPGPPPPAVARCLDRIAADSLRGHVSFLASDLLEGRGTPSRGLDLAAAYIAAQFRRAGLEPVGDDGYYQTADWKYRAPDPESFACEFRCDGRSIRVDIEHASGEPAAIDLPPTPTVKVEARDAEAMKALTPDQVKGKVVLAEVPTPYKVERSRAREANRARSAFLDRMDELGPALIVDVDRDEQSVLGLQSDVVGRRFRSNRVRVPRITLHSSSLATVFVAMPDGPSGAILALRVGPPKERSAKVRNVVGRIRGSDPDLSRTCAILSAHYDHLGIAPANPDGDRIYNGANDDASGTAAIVEIASALSTLEPRPKRSLVFVAFYGEEHGLVGSRYYVEHPIVPLADTVADINLEQLGRTDDSDGPRVAAANVTGFDYSDIGARLRRAGRAVGVDVTKHPTRSDGFFRASDNAAFATAGVPAHTISVAYLFPDYHGADDEWEKIDYANMARVARMAAMGLLEIADGPAPAWDASNPKTSAFRARRKEPAR